MKHKVLLLVGAFAVVTASCSSTASTTPATTKAAAATTASAGATAAAGGATTAARGATTAAGGAATTPGGAGGTAKCPLSGAGVDGNKVKIGVITSVTGAAAASFRQSPDGVKARFAVENAKTSGGTGCQFEFVTADDASSTDQNLTAVQSLVKQGIYALVAWDTFLAGSYRYLIQQNVPVFGICSDGQYWSNAESQNMFSMWGCNNRSYGTTTLANFFKEKGVTNLGLMGSNVESAIAYSKSVASGAKQIGLNVAYENYGLQDGATDTNPQALGMKSTGVDGVMGVGTIATDLALVTALKNNGVKPKAQLYPGVGYDNQTLSDATTKAAANEAYFTAFFRPVETGNPGAKAMQDALKKYANYDGIPGFDIAGGYLSADMFLAGVYNVAGKTAVDPKAFYTAYHTLKGYDADGVLASKLDMSTDWGKGAQGLNPKNCVFIVQLQGDKFVPQNNGEAYCGQVVPNSAGNTKGDGPKED